MRTTTHAATNPWGNSIDDGWKDLVVSSAPPPPPPTPRDAVEAAPKNRALPSDITTWQEHGSARAAEAAVEEPNFTAADRRLWLIAGTLMGLAVLVLGLLGFLTFGGSVSTNEPAAEPVHAVAASASEPVRAAQPTRVASAAVVAKPSANNPRALKKHARHHKRIAAR